MQYISHTELPAINQNAQVGTSRGGRIGSSKLRHSLEQCEEFTGLEENTNRYDLLLLVKRIGKGAGFSPRMIHLLDYYMSFTRDIDWEQGANPIVYQALSKTALDLGVSERQIQKLEKALFEAGALTWNDSGNHRRYGQRDPKSGMILYAYGVDLTPLAYLKDKLRHKLEEKQLYDKAWMEAKRQISWYRRQTKACIAELAALQADGALIKQPIYELEASYDAISIQIRARMELKSLLELSAKHKKLYEAILSMVPQSQSDDIITKDKTIIVNKSSSKSDQPFTHNNYTNKKQSNKLDTSKAGAQCSQKSSNEDIGGKNAISEPVETDEITKEENPILQTGLQHITLKQALNAASEGFRNHLPLANRAMEWGDFVEAAYALKGELNISQQSWANACVVLGRGGAAICLLLTDQAAQRERKRVEKPAAYFNAMIKRAKTGDLKLHSSIFGILKREHGNFTPETTN